MSAKLDTQPIPKTIIEYLEHIEVERNLSPLTVRDYGHYLDVFGRWAAGQGLQHFAQLDLAILKKYRLFLARQRGPDDEPITTRTQAYYIIALRSLLKWLISMDANVLAPEKIELPKVAPAQVKFLSSEQMQRLLQQPDVRTQRGLRDRALLEVLFSTGLRVSELAKLDRDQVNTERREFGVMGKGRKPRVVFLSEEAAHWLESYLSQRRDDWAPVFIRHAKEIDPADNGENMRLTPRSIQRMVEKYRKIAKIPMAVTPHSIRHSFATDLLRNGAGLRDVQEMLGHKNLATTQIYTHVTQPQLRAVHERFHSKSVAGSHIENED